MFKDISCVVDSEHLKLKTFLTMFSSLYHIDLSWCGGDSRNFVYTILRYCAPQHFCCSRHFVHTCANLSEVQNSVAHIQYIEGTVIGEVKRKNCMKEILEKNKPHFLVCCSLVNSFYFFLRSTQ